MQDKGACFRNSIKVNRHILSHFSQVQLFATPWTIAHQAPLSMGFSRQEYRSGLPCPPQGDLLNPGIKPMSPAAPALQADSLLLHHWGSLIITYFLLFPYFHSYSLFYQVSFLHVKILSSKAGSPFVTPLDLLTTILDLLASLPYFPDV